MRAFAHRTRCCRLNAAPRCPPSNPRSLNPHPSAPATHQIFAYLDGIASEYSVKCSYLELYNEEITDLLAVGADVPKVRACLGWCARMPGPADG